MMFSDAAEIKQSDNGMCDKHWQELSSRFTQKSPADYEGLLSAWKLLDKECGENARYKARLGLTYFFLDRPKDAKAALASVRSGGETEPLVQLVDILADTGVLHDAGKLNGSEIEKMERRLRVYSTNNPTDVVGISLLADVYSELGRYSAAIELYERALAMMRPSPRAAGIMRNLTIAYSEAARYEKSFDAAEKALALDKDLLSDMYFVCAVAKSQASIGKIDEAKDALTLLSLKRPEVSEHPIFKSAVAFVIQKAKSAGK